MRAIVLINRIKQTLAFYFHSTHLYKAGKRGTMRKWRVSFEEAAGAGALPPLPGATRANTNVPPREPHKYIIGIITHITYLILLFGRLDALTAYRCLILHIYVVILFLGAPQYHWLMH